MSVVGGVSGKADGGVINSVEFVKSALTWQSVDTVTEIECGEDGHFDKGEFSRGGESMPVSVEEP